MVFFFNFFQLKIKNLFYLISSPLQKKLWKSGGTISNFFASFLKIKKVEKEINSLKKENAALTAQIARLRNLEEENIFLRKALQIGLNEDFNLFMAEVIGKDPSQDSFLINKGKKDGVEKEMPVITEEKVLLGRIEEVYRDFSKVRLISNKKSSFDAEVQGKDVTGLVKGRGNFNLILDLVPYEKEINEGDLVITSSFGGIFPSGILVGKVKKIEKKDTEPFQKIEIEPSFNVSLIKRVFLIKSE